MEPSRGVELSFWRGYPVWLAGQKRWILGLVLLAVLAFVAALWLTGTPQDPFQYEIF